MARDNSNGTSAAISRCGVTAENLIMKKKFLITTVGIIVLSFTACRYIDNAVDHVIAGDAHSAARGFKWLFVHDCGCSFAA